MVVEQGGQESRIDVLNWAPEGDRWRRDSLGERERRVGRRERVESWDEQRSQERAKGAAKGPGQTVSRVPADIHRGIKVRAESGKGGGSGSRGGSLGASWAAREREGEREAAEAARPDRNNWAVVARVEVDERRPSGAGPQTDPGASVLGVGA